MKRSLIRKLGLALLALITPALAWAATTPTATWTWDGGDKTATGTLESGEAIYSCSGVIVAIPEGNAPSSNNFTLSLWTKYVPQSTWKAYFGVTNGTSQFHFQDNYGKGTGTGITASGDVGSSAALNNLSKDAYTLITTVSDGKTFKFYVNGSYVTGTTETTDWNVDTKLTHLGLGCYATISGTVDRKHNAIPFADVKFYNKTLSADEIKAVYDDYTTRAAAMAYRRTVTETAVDWSATDAWTLNGEKSEAPEDGKRVHLTVNEEATIAMNAEATLDAFTIDGTAKATFGGAKKLTASSTIINTTTDVSNITADLGAVTIEEGKTLTIGANTTFSSMTNNGTLVVNGTCTINQAISGSGSLTVSSGTLTLSNTETKAYSYSGATLINSGATLVLNGVLDYGIDAGVTNLEGSAITIESNGTLVAGNNVWRKIKGAGKLHVTNNKEVIIGRSSEALSGLSDEFTGTVQIDSGATAEFRNWNANGYAVTTGNFIVNGELKLTAGNVNDYSASTLTIDEGKTLSGTGTITLGTGTTNASLTFATGSKLDATAGALTVSGAVTLPADGTVTAKVASDAKAGSTILTCATEGLELTKITIEGVDGMVAAANDDNTAIVLATAAVVAGPYGYDKYASLQAAINYYVENYEAENWPSADFTFKVLAPITEVVELPSGYSFTLTNLDEFDITGLTVKDENGNEIDLEDGKYSNIPYIATVTIGETSTKCADMDAVLAAIAADGVTEATVTLHSSTAIGLEETWVITKTITLDLADVTLNAAFTYTAANPAAIWVKNGGKLTLKNGTLSSAAEGVRLGEKGATDTSKAGELVIESNASIITTDIGVMIYGGSTLTSNGTINASGTNATAIQGNGLETVPTSITIPSGTVMSANDHAIYHPQPGTLTIGKDGGTMYPYITGVTGIEMRAGEVEMLSGTIFANGSYAVAANGSGSTVTGAALAISQHATDAAAEGIKVTVAAGALNGACSLAVVNTTDADAVPVTGTIVGTALGYGANITVPTVALESDADSGYTLKTVVAQVGENKYETLAAAVTAAAENAEITVLANITEGGLKITKPVTIDFGGYTYTIVSPGVGSGTKTSNGIQIVESAEAVTLKNGTIQIAAKDATDFYILIQNYADLKLINMTLDGTNLDKWIAQYDDSYTLSVNSGTVSLEGTTTIKANNDGDKSYAFDSHDYAEMGYDAPTVIVGENVTITGKVEVSGGTLDNDSTKVLDVVISSGKVKGEVTVNESSSYLAKVGDTYCDKVEIKAKDGESAVDAEARALAALELFDGIATVEGSTAKVAYDFGISSITVDRYDDGTLTGNVTITAKVQTDATTAPSYADGVTVSAYADDGKKLIASTTTTDATDSTVTLTVGIEVINGKDLTVKVSK